MFLLPDAVVTRAIYMPADRLATSILLALLFAWFFFGQMKRESEGTERMAYIAAAVRKGAMAYLKQQYKVVAVVFAVLAVILSLYVSLWAGIVSSRVILDAVSLSLHSLIIRYISA